MGSLIIFGDVLLTPKEPELAIFKPENYGGRDTNAIGLACAAIQANGSGKLLLSSGTYPIYSPKNKTLITFGNLNGVAIECQNDAKIVDMTNYSASETSNLFDFITCQKISLKATIVSQSTNYKQKPCGLWAASFYRGCKGIYSDINLQGCLGGLRPTRLYNEPDSYISSAIRGQLKAENCYYPHIGQFSGNDVELDLETNMCGRSFFLYGVENQTINLKCRNQQVTSIITAYSGMGCNNVNVSITDRNSTFNQSAAPRLTFGFGDATPATLRNLKFHFNLKNPKRSPFGAALTFAKHRDGQYSPDNIGRGHLIDGLEISGVMDGIPGFHHANIEAGAFSAPDIIRNVRIGPLSLNGRSAFHLPLDVLGDDAFYTDVHSDHNLYTNNGINGRVIFRDSSAMNFTGSKSVIDRHEYHDCEITDGSFQNETDNKLFVNTTVPKR